MHSMKPKPGDDQAIGKISIESTFIEMSQEEQSSNDSYSEKPKQRVNRHYDRGM